MKISFMIVLIVCPARTSIRIAVESNVGVTDGAEPADKLKAETPVGGCGRRTRYKSIAAATRAHWAAMKSRNVVVRGFLGGINPMLVH